MNVNQCVLTNVANLAGDLQPIKAIDPNLIFAFGSFEFFSDKALGRRLKAQFPSAQIVGCSTAGEISDGGVTDKTIVVTGVHFEKIKPVIVKVKGGGLGHAMAAGEKLSAEIKSSNDVKGVFVLSPGTNVNGSALIDGLQSNLTKTTLITGGLAGDGGKFVETMVMCNEEIAPDLFAAVAFTGRDCKMQFGCFGGWEAVGESRKVTKALGNLMFEIDGRPALEVYKELIGPEHAKNLPRSGLLFPFAIVDDRKPGIIRTLLGTNEGSGSLVLAGDIRNGCHVTLMKADTPNLVQGAEMAAKHATKAGRGAQKSLSLLVSCVGRKLVMGDQVGKEVKTVKNILNSHITGFYSYGEICPQGEFIEDCRLHNQTMTITRIEE